MVSFIDCTAVLAGSSLRSKSSISRTLLPLLFFHQVQEMIYQELFIGDQAILYALYYGQNSLGKRSNQRHIKVYRSFAWYILFLFILIEQSLIWIVGPYPSQKTTRRSKYLLSLSSHCQDLPLNCYFGIGVDADVALQFHEMRNRNPSLFESQLLNKFFYTILGGRKTIVSKPVPLESIIDLYIDDKKKSLENIEGLVVLNIPYYAGGGIPWDNQYKQNIRDGLIEIIGFSSLVHCATMKACHLIVYYALGRSQLCLYDWSGTIHSYRGQEEELDAGMSHFSPLCCRLMANHGCSPLVTFISTIETLS